MPAKYQLYKDKAGKYRFRLIAENGRTIVSGEAYERRYSCLNGIESVKKNSGASIEDTTIDSPKIAFPKYQIYTDKAGEYRFNLSASNGEVIASSEGYSSKAACLNGINAVQRIGNSETEDLTSTYESQNDEPKKEVVSTVALERNEEIETKVAQKEILESKKQEPEVTYKEEIQETYVPATAVARTSQTTNSNEIQIKRSKGISKVAIAILVVGLVIGILLLATGLGFAGILASTDVLAKLVLQIAGELIICASILLFFAKK